MENPVLNDDTAGEALRALGAQADAGADTSSVEQQPDTHATGAEETTDDTAAPPKVDGENSDNPENQKPADQQQVQKQKPADQVKEPSKYEKAQQREADAWKKIEAEKAEIARQKAELERQRSQTQRQPEPRQPVKDERGFTAADYEEAAKGFDVEGETDLAKQARDKAGELKQRETSASQNGQREKFQNDWRADMEATLAKHADLGKPDTADAKELGQLLTDEPIFGHIPNGFSKAVQLLQLRREAATVPGLKERAEKAEQEVERLTKLTAINGGSPTPPAGGAKTFDQMNEAEQRDHLEREAQKADMAIW